MTCASRWGRRAPRVPLRPPPTGGAHGPEIKMLCNEVTIMAKYMQPQMATVCCDRSLLAHSANFVITTSAFVSRKDILARLFAPPLACCARGQLPLSASTDKIFCGPPTWQISHVVPKTYAYISTASVIIITTLSLDRRYFNLSRYDTIRDAILTCARKPTWVSWIYRTEPTTKKCKNRKTKSRKHICSK